MFRLVGKVAAIIGVTRGIGRAMSIAAAEARCIHSIASAKCGK
ncbi:hypothetical protein [Peribacillus sp. SCS-155]